MTFLPVALKGSPNRFASFLALEFILLSYSLGLIIPDLGEIVNAFGREKAAELDFGTVRQVIPGTDVVWMEWTAGAAHLRAGGMSAEQRKERNGM